MKEQIKSTAAELAGSKKATALLIALLVTLLQIPLIKLLDMPQEQAIELATTASTLIVGAASAYILAQGVADHGKEAAKIDAQAKAPGKEEV